MGLKLAQAASLALAVGAVATVAFWKLQGDSWGGPAPARLSYFEAHAGGCAWYRQAIGRDDREQLALFPTDCAVVHVAFPPALDHAVVAFEADLRGDEPLDALLFDVDLARGKPTRLPLPEPGEAKEYAFDEKGVLYAFTLDFEVEVSDGATELTARGQRYPRAATDGTDALARALRFSGGRWVPIEAAATRCCVAGAPGVQALSVLQRLKGDPKLAWLRREAKPVGAETAQKSKLSALPEFPFAPREAIEVASLGTYMLITEARTGTRAVVYDRESTHRLMFAQHSTGATFWPGEGPAAPR